MNYGNIKPHDYGQSFINIYFNLIIILLFTTEMTRSSTTPTTATSATATPTPTTPKPPDSMPPWAITLMIIIPVLVIGTLVAIYCFKKKAKDKSTAYAVPEITLSNNTGVAETDTIAQDVNNLNMDYDRDSEEPSIIQNGHAHQNGGVGIANGFTMVDSHHGNGTVVWDQPNGAVVYENGHARMEDSHPSDHCRIDTMSVGGGDI